MQQSVHVIQSIQRAIDIINTFDSQDNYKLSLPEISKKVALNINTVRGIVNTLVVNGYLEHDKSDNTYSLGLVFLPKADLLSNHQVLSVRDFVRPELEKISQEYETTTSFQLISNDNMFTVETAKPPNSHYVLYIKMFTVFPLHATASGKLCLYYKPEDKLAYTLDQMDMQQFTLRTITDKEALRSELKKIEKQGYSTENEEIGRGLSCIAVPVLKQGNVLYGTVSVTASTPIIETLPQKVIADLMRLANKISKRIDPYHKSNSI